MAISAANARTDGKGEKHSKQRTGRYQNLKKLFLSRELVQILPQNMLIEYTAKGRNGIRDFPRTYRPPLSR